MIRKLACAVAVMAVAVGFVMADTVTCRIEKMEGNTITVQKYTKAKKGQKAEKEGDAWTVKVAKDATIAKGMFNKDTKSFDKGDAIEGGVKALAAIVTKAGEKGVNVVITTDKDGGKGTASQVLIVGGKKKKAAAE
jgi:hypothetical protein